MKFSSYVVAGLFTLLLAGSAYSDNARTAESFIDAFYSYDPARLAGVMDAGVEGERMLYYQSWAEAANYKIKKRKPCSAQDSFLVCRITVTDDFGLALGYIATDTFTLLIRKERVVSAKSKGDDPPIFMELFEWISANQPEVLAGPCLDMFEGGQTPGECARSVAQAAKQFMKMRNSND